jgi:hypothetical protein
LRYDGGRGRELIGDRFVEVVEGEGEEDKGDLERKCERRVPWKWARDNMEVSVVGKSRWVERRFQMERKWNIVNYKAIEQ